MEDDEEGQDGFNDPMLCRALWLSVIAQALVDAKSKSRKLTNLRNRSRALAWFNDSLEEGSDFEFVCDLAGVRPGDVRRILKSMREGKKTVDFRCLRKPKLIDRLIIREKLEANKYTNNGERRNGNS